MEPLHPVPSVPCPPAAPSDPAPSALATLPLLYPDLAGIDVGAREHYVALPPGRATPTVRTFGCTTPELEALAAWLKQGHITDVVLESTGVYWVPVASVLEDAGLRVFLVDAREAHRLSARTTDVQDCQWLRQLFACGLLRQAFRPPRDLLPARAYWRQRQELVGLCATALHHMQKALELMNLQVHKVLSDLGGLTGMSLLRAIVAGQRDPAFLLTLVHPACKATPEQFEAALTGHYTTEQLLALRQALARFDLYQGQIADLDRHLEAHLQQHTRAAHVLAPPPAPAVPAAPAPTRARTGAKRRKNQCHFDLRAEVERLVGVDLTRIEGIDALTAFTLIVEQGLDMSAFPTEKHFASHLGLCPNHRITGGKVRTRTTRKVQSRAAQALRMAAQSLARSDSALGAFYRRIKGRHGPAKANVATAHKLAKLIYRLIKHGEAYVAQGREAYEAQYRDHQRQALQRKAHDLGYTLLVTETGEILA